MAPDPLKAGWYPDPEGSGMQRRFDGDRWTHELIPSFPGQGRPLSKSEKLIRTGQALEKGGTEMFKAGLLLLFIIFVSIPLLIALIEGKL